MDHYVAESVGKTAWVAGDRATSAENVPGMNVQTAIDELFRQWLITNQNYAKDASIIKGYEKFQRELVPKIRQIYPTCFNDPNIQNQLKALEWINMKGERPYIWDGELGIWFSDKLKINTIAGKLYSSWNHSFNPINEYKEWCTLYQREPKLTKIIDPQNKLGVKGGGNLSRLEHRLATWAHQIKQLNMSGSLTDQKHQEIDDILGQLFDWTCIIDTTGSTFNKKRRQNVMDC